MYNSLIVRIVFVLGWVLVSASCSKSPVVREPTPLPAMSSPLDIQLQWQLKVGKLSDTDSEGLNLAIDTSSVYFASPNGTLTAAKVAANGAWSNQIIWQKRFAEPLLSGVTLINDGLLVGTAKSRVYKIAKANGDILWQAALSSEVLSQPVVGGGKVFLRTVDGKVYALSENTGEVIWVVEHQVPNLSLRGIAAVTLSGDTLYIGWESGHVEALSAKDGGQLWQTQVVVPKGRTDLERLVDIQAPIIEHKGRLYVLAFHGKLAAMNPRTGNLLWSKDVSGFQSMLMLNNLLLMSDEDDVIQAYDLQNGTKVWQNTRFKYRQLCDLKLDANHRVVFGDAQGHVHWLDGLNGTLLARANYQAGTSVSQRIVALYPDQQRLYVNDENGYLSQYQVVKSDVAEFYEKHQQVLNALTTSTKESHE